MKTEKTVEHVEARYTADGAAMELGHEDREDVEFATALIMAAHAAMELGHEDREDAAPFSHRHSGRRAAMELGHEDREDAQTEQEFTELFASPPWSSVMKTEKTPVSPTTWP